ncbi:MAG: mevalonate kinase [Deltaproteobacteria bacterium]|nr:mevalonate kinase [Deltaproteobacteria bacterium]
MQEVRAEAQGKFILIGEHFIVDGEVPAIAFPLKDLKTTVTLQKDGKNSFVINSTLTLSNEEEIKTKMEEAFKKACFLFKINDFFKIKSTSNFPLQRGFGSSASFSVALCRAMAKFKRKHEWIIPNAVEALEKIFHGKPSGIDTTTILRESPVLFEKGKEPKVITNKACDFVLVDSGERKSCKELVSKIQEIKKEHPKIWKSMSSRVRELSLSILRALKEGDIDVLSETVNASHDVLASLNLSHGGIEEQIRIGIEERALASKISGAGCGGALLFVAERGDGQGLAERLKTRGLQVVGVVEAL